MSGSWEFLEDLSQMIRFQKKFRYVRRQAIGLIMNSQKASTEKADFSMG